MAREDAYGSTGSVPTVESQGGGGTPSSARATPDAFGANVGEAVQKAGQTTQDLAIHYQQLATDSLTRDAVVNSSQKLGDLLNTYKQQKGLNAASAYPVFQQQAQQLYEDTAASMPSPAAQKQFRDNFSREVSYSMKEAGGWAAGQTEEANVSSYKSSIINDQNQLASAPTDPVRQQQIIGQIHNDSLTLSHSMGASAAEADANFTQHVGDGVSALIESTYKTNPALARSLIDKYYDGGLTATRKDADGNDVQVQVPFLNATQKATIARDSYYLESAHQKATDGIVAGTGGQVLNNNYGAGGATTSPSTLNMNEADLNKPAPLSVRNNNPGNIEDPATGKFRQFSSPEEGTQAMQTDLTAKITGNSPAMRRNFGANYSPTLANVISTWAPSSENNTANYIKTVSAQTGIAPDKVLTTADIAKIMPAMIGVEGGAKASSYFNTPSAAIFASGRNNPQQSIDGAAGNPQMQRDIASNLLGYTPLADDVVTVSKTTGDAQTILQSTMQVKQQMLQSDPGGFVMQHNTLLNTSQNDVLSNPSQNLAPYAKNMDFIYDSIKQPAENRPLFSQQTMDDFAQKLYNAGTSQGLQALTELKTQTGHYWPRIETQLAHTNGVPPQVMVGLDVAPNMQSTFAKSYAIEDQAGKPGTEKKDWSSLVPDYANNSKTVESTLNGTAWRGFVATLDQQNVPDTKIKAYEEGVRNLSMQLILSGDNASHAADAAVKAFTSQYKIPSDSQYKARIPKEIASVVMDNADTSLDNMTPASLNIPRGFDQAQQQAYVNDVKSNGHWINNSDNTGLNRVDGGLHLVRNRDSSVLTIPFTGPAQGHAAAQETVSSQPPGWATTLTGMMM